MLTDTQISNAKPKDRPYKLPKKSGLYLIVNPNGAKWWRFTYSFGGKGKTLSLGTYPLIPLNLARQRRDAARRLVAEGIDPSAQRRAEREETIGDAPRFLSKETIGDAPRFLSK
jgi:hypothetical protein